MMPDYLHRQDDEDEWIEPYFNDEEVDTSDDEDDE
jgi:hypothetical protein